VLRAEKLPLVMRITASLINGEQNQNVRVFSPENSTPILQRLASACLLIDDKRPSDLLSLESFKEGL